METITAAFRWVEARKYLSPEVFIFLPAACKQGLQRSTSEKRLIGGKNGKSRACDGFSLDTGVYSLGQHDVVFSREVTVIQSSYQDSPKELLSWLDVRRFVLEIVQEVEKQRHHRLGPLKTGWLF